MLITGQGKAGRGRAFGFIHLTAPAPPFLHLHLKDLEDQLKTTKVVDVGHDLKRLEQISVDALGHQDLTEEVPPCVSCGDVLGNEQCWEHP